MEMEMERFLRRCLLSPWQPQARAKVAATLAADEVDWSVFQEAVRRERVGPLLYDRLGRRGWLPQPVEAGLRQAYAENSLRAGVMFLALEEILGALAARGIETVVLKGSALAGTVYPNPAVRFMTDLDLLVDPAQVDGLLAILTQRGYTPQPEVRPGYYRRYRSEMALMAPGAADFSVEPHWDLLDSPAYYGRMTLAHLRPWTRPQAFGSRSARVLGPELLFLHLCAHLMLQNQGQGLARWHDLLAFLHQPDLILDWDQMGNLAQTFRLVLPLQRAFTTLQQEWGVTWPPGVAEGVDALIPTPFEMRIAQRYTHPQRMRRYWLALTALPAWPSRLGDLWEMATPSPAYMMRRYDLASPVHLPAAYLRRWLGAPLRLLTGPPHPQDEQKEFT